MLENTIMDKMDENFFQRMCAEQVELPELKRFVANKQFQKISDKIAKEIGELEQELGKFAQPPINILIKLGLVRMQHNILINIPFTNLDDYIAVVDACNISQNGEENCDIIVGKATEDELQIYVYELMKKREEEKSKKKVKS